MLETAHKQWAMSPSRRAAVYSRNRSTELTEAVFIQISRSKRKLVKELPPNF